MQTYLCLDLLHDTVSILEWVLLQRHLPVIHQIKFLQTLDILQFLLGLGLQIFQELDVVEPHHVGILGFQHQHLFFRSIQAEVEETLAELALGDDPHVVIVKVLKARLEQDATLLHAFPHAVHSLVNGQADLTRCSAPVDSAWFVQ